MIPRLYYIDTVFVSREYISRTGLDSFLGSGLKREITRYRVRFYGIVVQEEGVGELHLVSPGEKIVLFKPTTTYCRWNTGSLFERDEPLSRKYCLRKASTHLGYCMEHKDSVRAVYSMCFETAGVDSLRSCWLLDERVGDKLSYTVYLLAYSSGGFKVGATRTWRLLHRIAEQPHIAATVLYRTNSAVKARDTEIKAGRLEGLTEKPHRVLRETINTPVRMVIGKLESLKEKITRNLRLDYREETVPFQIAPGIGIEYYVRARESFLDQLYEKHLEIIDYYAGYLLLSDINTNMYYLVKGGKLLHIDTLKTI